LLRLKYIQDLLYLLKGYEEASNSLKKEESQPEMRLGYEGIKAEKVYKMKEHLRNQATIVMGFVLDNRPILESFLSVLKELEDNKRVIEELNGKLKRIIKDKEPIEPIVCLDEFEKEREQEKNLDDEKNRMKEPKRI